MYNTCPKCQYERQAHDNSVEPGICPACGLIFSKWMKSQFASNSITDTGTEQNSDDAADSLIQRLLATVLYVEDKTEPVYFYGRAILFLVLVVFAWRFIGMEFETDAIGRTFLHKVNLVFHEAGHVIFSPFGYFMTKLGGTLGQILMPAIVMFVFLFQQHNTFAASVGLWWTGQNFLDCAPYVNDALHQDLVLLGGVTGHDRPGFHDWNSILGELNMLEKHHEVATLFDNTGAAVMLLSLIWGALVLHRQYQYLK